VIAIYVHPAHVCHGVGTAILRSAVNMARAGHNGPIRLEATLNAQILRACWISRSWAVCKNKKVRFSFYRDNQLFYRTEDGFEFPVPIDDVGNATFLAEDKAILFMRWIRKHIDTIEKAKKEQQRQSQ
jgi:hypothetical protein